MKLLIFKITLLCLSTSIFLAPICFAQTENDRLQPNQNTEVFGENDRLPFMQPENSVVNNEPSSGGLLIRTLGAMILIVGLIFFGAWGLKKLGFGNSQAKSVENVPDLEIVNSVSLGGGRTISTVRFGERILLVGSTAQSFTLLADESDKELLGNSKPRSVAEMLAEQTDSFADEFARAETNLSDWTAEGDKIQ